MKSTSSQLLRMSYAKKTINAGIFAIILGTFSGCASDSGVKTLSVVGEEPVKKIETTQSAEVGANLQNKAIARSKERWALLLAGKFEDTFPFLTAASQKGINAADYGRRMASLRFRKADVVSATCDGDACVVTVNVRIGQMVTRVGEVPHELPIEERWVQVDGTLGLIRR